MVPIQVSHLLLGCPWQYDRRSSYDGRKNNYSFVKDNRRVKLLPLSPKEVQEDKLRIKQACDSRYGSSSSRGELSASDKTGKSNLLYMQKQFITNDLGCISPSVVSFLQDYFQSNVTGALQEMKKIQGQIFSKKGGMI